MKIYKFVGNKKAPSLGVPGIRSVIEKSRGDALIKEYETAKKKDAARAKEAISLNASFSPAYLEGMPGYILKCALENGNFVEGVKAEEKEAEESKPDKGVTDG